jgi:D-beta-D-heptose 7-phosphate kinase/D-beta-D-heptose 1-phosphate adenosyltransferase
MPNNLDSILDQHLSQVPKFWKILLLGDTCTDKYVYGTIDRLSPEAPVPVFVPKHEENRRGMAGNVEENLKALGCDVTLLTLEGGTKTRFIDERSNQHIMRLDQDAKGGPIELAVSIPAIYDAVVISDYNKGCISYELVEQVLQQFSGPVFIDTKKTDLARFEGAFVKINSLENSLAKTLSSQTIVTLGKQGCEYAGQTYPAPKVEVADVCGAGDTFLAALVYSFLETNSIPEALVFANRAAAITVKHIGVYAPTLKEINEA